MSNKIFSQRFNRELALLGFPDEMNRRIDAVAKVFNVNRHLANSMLFGNKIPPEEQLKRIAEILEVCPQWLDGSINRKKPYSEKES